MRGGSLAAWVMMVSLSGCATQDGGPADLPLGSICEGPSQCSSNLCIATGGPAYCSQPCPDGSCPTGYLCIDSATGPVCAQDANARPPMNPDAGMLLPPTGGAGGGGGPVGLACPDIVTCTNPCGNDQGCFDACVAQGDAEGQGLFNAVIECVVALCPDGNAQCQQSMCGAELNACFADMADPGPGPGPSPTPSSACQSIDLCIYGTCTVDSQIDANCAQGCIDNAEVTAQTQYQAVADCVSSQCAGSADPACLINQCGEAYQACFPPGATPCNDVMDCVLQCDDFACQRQCQQGGTLEAQRQFLLYADCFNQNGCEAVNDCGACDTALAVCRGG
ncbi:MAG: hypothetical protein ACE366_03720 [Bradymonadia bacterium]